MAADLATCVGLLSLACRCRRLRHGVEKQAFWRPALIYGGSLLGASGVGYGLYRLLAEKNPERLIDVRQELRHRVNDKVERAAGSVFQRWYRAARRRWGSRAHADSDFVEEHRS